MVKKSEIASGSNTLFRVTARFPTVVKRRADRRPMHDGPLMPLNQQLEGP